MSNTKAPRTKPKPQLDPESESWRMVPWRKLEQHVYRLQKRIFRASQQGNMHLVHKLQKLLTKSRSARLLAVRRVTQDNQGKNTAGIDGIKAVPPGQRFELAEQIHPKEWKQRKPRPVRRVWIPKPGKEEKRPLGIPVMMDRATQCLIKLGLEPEWEAHFEPNSYGFRPGRAAQDAKEAIFNAIRYQPKFVVDADIAGCFDNISHPALLAKLSSFPALRRMIKAWLKAGILDEEGFHETIKGTPQGGVASPLLMNIALHGIETAIQGAFSYKEGTPQVIRYADDLVILHSTETGVQKAKRLLETWLSPMGLELKPSKTKLTHTLHEYQGSVGFDFLGWTIRQFPVGRTHTGKNTRGKPLGFKTIIFPSKEAVKRHHAGIKEVIKRNQDASQEQLIKELNRVNRGWANYHRRTVASKTFHRCDHVLYLQLRRWAKRRHPHKGMRWIVNKYWHVEEGKGWNFRSQETMLWKHGQAHIQRHIKVKGTASPYDGNMMYWSQRLRTHPMFNGVKGALLHKQQGRCRWCGLLLQDTDVIEIDHITPREQGGGEEVGNKCLLHRHCHDDRHAQRAKGISDNDHIIEEPDEGKRSCPVLKPSRGGNSFA
jgi:RNA-directed DNA polymerase